jgi:hypothetical protein
MDWKVIAALGLLAVALIAGLLIAVVSSVNSYAKRFAEGRKDTRRGFEVKTTNAVDPMSPVLTDKKDDHHG